ncbi:MAG: CDP-6-deoxy-delta-3,4-glucoseen reductase [Betaproteobacteria bacterium]
MGFKISVQPSQHEFQAEAGETILDAALRHGLMMPYGCRDGACGACRGKVIEGMVDHGKAQIYSLGESEREEGFALFCCASAQSDLVIESREVRSAVEIPVRTLPARVEKLTRVAPDVMLVELRLPPGERLQFFAGQYIDILLKEGRRRAFSLANAPHDDRCLQLHVREIPGGVFTGHVFSAMKERDMLRLNGPHGSFFLREDSAKPILLVAGSTGFAPIKAIVEHALAECIKRPMTIYWGGRRRSDLYLEELAAGWADKYANITFIPVLSESPESDGWQGRSGFVHEAAMEDFPDLSGHQVYVCGSPAMVAAARRDFVGKCSLPEIEFIADSFEFSNDVTAVPNPLTIAG